MRLYHKIMLIVLSLILVIGIVNAATLTFEKVKEKGAISELKPKDYYYETTKKEIKTEIKEVF